MMRNFRFTIISWIIVIILFGYSAWGVHLKIIGSDTFKKSCLVFYVTTAIAILMAAVAFFVTSREVKKARLCYDKPYSNVSDILCAISYGFSTLFLIKGIYCILAFFVIPKKEIEFMNILAPLGALIVYLIAWSKVSSNKYKLIGLGPFLVFLIMLCFAMGF